MTRRSDLEMKFDICRCLAKKSPMKASRIVYCANISYDRVTLRLKELERCELVRETPQGWMLTPKGTSFIENFVKMLEVFE